MNQLSLRNNRLKFKIAGKVPLILEEFIEYTPRLSQKTGGCQHVTYGLANNRVSTDYAHESPDHWVRRISREQTKFD